MSNITFYWVKWRLPSSTCWIPIPIDYRMFTTVTGVGFYLSEITVLAYSWSDP